MSRSKTFRTVLGIFFVFCILLSSNAGAAAHQVAKGRQQPGPIATLVQATGGTARVSLSPATGLARFISIQPGSLPFNLQAQTESEADRQARAFLDAYGAAFGVASQRQELSLQKVLDDTNGGLHASYQQVYRGIPVFGGVLRVHFTADGLLNAANGVFIPDIRVPATPALSQAEAGRIAVERVASQNAGKVLAASIEAKKTTLYVFRTNLARGLPGEAHLAYEVEAGNEAGVREFVYVDALSGEVLDQITGVYDSLTRRIYKNGVGDSYLVWKEGDPYPYTGGDSIDQRDANRLIDYAQDTYNLFASLTNGAYLSWDAADGILHSAFGDALFPAGYCPNANWNGVSTNYCFGITGDDTVAHEWGHAYTQGTHDLIYQWQSGALNESYSDIWGEVVDLLNGAGIDSPSGLRSTGGCSLYGFPRGSDNTYRWMQGEDDPGFHNIPIRDMWNPACYGDPGKVSDTGYQCTTDDGGGVHTNSGVPNHAFALVVDGGTYNGQTLTGIGLTKAASIYWRAQSVYQTPTSDFADHAAALRQSCSDLKGQTLYDPNPNSPTGVASSQVIIQADCDSLNKAILATQMDNPPAQCNFAPLLAQNPPALCGAGETAVPVAANDWEAGLRGWTVGKTSVANPATFDTPNWAAVGPLPDGRAGLAAFAEDNPNLGDCAADDESGVVYLESPPVVLPAGVTTKLAFDHWVATEFKYDGGNLKISVNGGPWALVPGSAFSYNAYNTTFDTAANGNTNPLASQAAFSGTDGGQNSGSWGQSQASLAGLASPGDTIRLRFEMGLDGCGGIIGWYVDDVKLYRCSAQAPNPVYVDDSFNAGTTGISLDHFTSIQDGLNAVASGGTVEVAAGTYTEPVILNKAVTLRFNGDVTLISSFNQSAGTFTAYSGNLTLSGDFTRSGGTFNASGGTLVFAGAGQQSLALQAPTTFNNLTVQSGTTLVETFAAANATVGGTLTNNGTIRKSQAVSGAASYDFGLTGAKLDLATAGSLTSLQVERVDQNHPNAGSSHLQTGRYWTLTPNTGASGFTAALTLPVTFTPATDGSDKLCRYTAAGGDPYPFDCGLASENVGDAGAKTIRRSNVTAFSSWTAGRNTAPTALKLVSLKSEQPDSNAFLFLAMSLGVMCAGLATARRKRE